VIALIIGIGTSCPRAAVISHHLKQHNGREINVMPCHPASNARERDLVCAANANAEAAGSVALDVPRTGRSASFTPRLEYRRNQVR
jgi:hypothetical protein